MQKSGVEKFLLPSLNDEPAIFANPEMELIFCHDHKFVPCFFLSSIMKFALQ